MANTRAPDTYVKLVLMSSSGQEIAHSKTSVRRGQPNPLFKETFMFQVRKTMFINDQGLLFTQGKGKLCKTCVTKCSIDEYYECFWFIKEEK